MAKILITGATGFIGSHLFDLLLSKGYDVYGISNIRTKKSISKIPLLNKKKLNSYFKKTNFDVVIHLASLTKEADITSMFKNNVLSTLNILNCCKLKKIKKFILISGHNVYSQNSKIPMTEKAKILPSTNYGLTKLLQENLAEFYAKNHLLDVIILRLSYTYGPNQPLDKMIPTLINKYVNSKPIILNKYKNGFQKIDVINIHDVCKVIENTLKIKKNFDIFNISYGEPITVKDILKTLKQNIKSNSSVSIREINKKTIHYQYDNSHAKKILNFKPTVNLEKGIKELIKIFI